MYYLYIRLLYLCYFDLFSFDFFFFFNDTATTEIYTLSLHDALPISPPAIAREALPPAVHGRDVPEQRAHRDPGRALGPERQLALGEGGARDVEVRPRDPGGELAHEERGHDGPRPALARDVVEVRDVALEPFPVLVVERQAPHALPRRVGGGEHARAQAVVARHHPGEPLPERDHHRAGQRGHVDHLVRLDVLDRVGERVGQGQASLRVGVPDLDGEPVHGPHDVARPLGGARGHVLDRKSTRLNSSHMSISYAVFCLKKKTRRTGPPIRQRRPAQGVERTPFKQSKYVPR